MQNLGAAPGVPTITYARSAGMSSHTRIPASRRVPWTVASNLPRRDMQATVLSAAENFDVRLPRQNTAARSAEGLPGRKG